METSPRQYTIMDVCKNLGYSSYSNQGYTAQVVPGYPHMEHLNNFRNREAEFLKKTLGPRLRRTSRRCQ